MSIDYSGAGSYALHVQALAQIESGEDVGQIGDGGRAFGILQQHPSFFLQWCRDVSVADTWWQAQINAAAAFLEHYVPILGSRSDDPGL